MNKASADLRGFILFIIFLMTACVSYVKPGSEMCAKAFPVIEDGKMTKDEIVRKLGMPGFKYKKESIWIYVEFGRSEPCDLVLVFDENGLVSKHSMVQR